MAQCLEISQNSLGPFSLISGNDADTVRIIEAGGTGVISVLANAFPSEMKRITSLALNNKLSEAALALNGFKNLIPLLFEEGNPAGIKALLAAKGMIKNILRLPLVPVSPTLHNKFLNLL